MTENKDTTAGIRHVEGRVYIGYDPTDERWEILAVGTIIVKRSDKHPYYETVYFPGWHMRSSTGVELVASGAPCVQGPDISSQLRVGGYSVSELQKISAER